MQKHLAHILIKYQLNSSPALTAVNLMKDRHRKSCPERELPLGTSCVEIDFWPRLLKTLTAKTPREKLATPERRRATIGM
jgi:hypothetical protein